MSLHSSSRPFRSDADQLRVEGIAGRRPSQAMLVRKLLEEQKRNPSNDLPDLHLSREEVSSLRFSMLL